MTSFLTKITVGIYGCTASFLTPVVKHHLRKRRTRGKEHPQRHNERLGYAGEPRPTGKLIWIHGASVGESLSILPLIEELNKQQSDLNFLVTTGTLTSAQLMAQRLPTNARHQFIPVDLPAAVERFITHWKPDLGLIVESELWPQLIFRACQHKVPLLLVNGRMSGKSLRSWLRVPFFIRDLLGCFRLILAQSRQDARHFEQLGAPRVKDSGNLKFAALPLLKSQDDLEELRKHIANRPIWFASSTHRTEEIFLAKVQQKLQKRLPGLLCIIAPRHPERGEEILTEIRAESLTISSRSKKEDITDKTDIYLADTLGELGLFYELSPVVVIGGSLLRKGGQNLLEPARQNCAVVCGPEMQNFQEISDAMVSAGAVIKLQSIDELENCLFSLLNNPERCQALAGTAKNYMESKGREIHQIAQAVLQELPRS
ncbi:3-deoxy-D-manno-octulosonic acid transferase [Kiloniella laminariae]|uniref:3-deoxy-D-manno-octulosonic acid transferase n=1 Tax=Kiloniella laminariae TaxID=454162 RepID=A0ABT4LIF8_9PROT|nr:3-deoxy-D-manno-octulosonic acid transferase [Kiloniella laminariae]MCZ4280893.1 3-deoxy-D-manno-octulosonic acid transferase [Kiloniella laminariae]